MKNYISILISCTFLCFFISCTKTDIPIIVDEPVTPSELAERVIKDTAYGADPKQKMDIYLPAGRTNKTKLIVLVHGGAWIGGDKGELNSYVSRFKAKWPEAAIANINYRFANGSTILCKDILADMKLAINMMTLNKDYFSISDNVALFGNSAGGHLVLMYAYTTNTEGYVKCVADLYGPTQLNDWGWYNVIWPPIASWLQQVSGKPWNESLYKSLSPLQFVNEKVVPTAIFHSTYDIVVPVRHSQILHQQLDAKNVPNIYKEYGWGLHDFSDADNNDCASRTVNFFKQHLQ